jgi:hypothetical protein
MKAIKIIPALVLLTLSLNAKPTNEVEPIGSLHYKENNNEIVETVKNNISCPAELFNNKNNTSVRLSFSVNKDGKAENVIINAEDEKVKQFVNEKLNKLEFPQKNEEVNMVIHFKLA